MPASPGSIPDMAKLHLRLGPGQRRCRVRRPWYRDACRPDRAALRGWPPPWSRRRRVPSAPGATRTRRRRRRPDRARCRPCLTAAGLRSPRSRCECSARGREIGPDRFQLRSCRPLALHDREMRQPRSGLVRRAPPSRCQHRAFVGKIFGLHKQLGKCRMRDVSRLPAPARFRNRRSVRPRAHVSRYLSPRSGGLPHRLRPRRQFPAPL